MRALWVTLLAYCVYLGVADAYYLRGLDEEEWLELKRRAVETGSYPPAYEETYDTTMPSDNAIIQYDWNGQPAGFVTDLPAREDDLYQELPMVDPTEETDESIDTPTGTEITDYDDIYYTEHLPEDIPQWEYEDTQEEGETIDDETEYPSNIYQEPARTNRRNKTKRPVGVTTEENIDQEESSEPSSSTEDSTESLEDTDETTETYIPYGTTETPPTEETLQRLNNPPPADTERKKQKKTKENSPPKDIKPSEIPTEKYTTPSTNKKVDRQEVTTTQRPTDIHKSDPVTVTETTNETTETTRPPKTTEKPVTKAPTKKSEKVKSVIYLEDIARIPAKVLARTGLTALNFIVGTNHRKRADDTADGLLRYNTPKRSNRYNHVVSEAPKKLQKKRSEGSKRKITEWEVDQEEVFELPSEKSTTDESVDAHIDQEEVFELPTKRPTKKQKQTPTTVRKDNKKTQENVDKYKTDHLEPREENTDMDIELQEYDDEINNPNPIRDVIPKKRPAVMSLADLFLDTGNAEDSDETEETFNRPTPTKKPFAKNGDRKIDQEEISEIPATDESVSTEIDQEEVSEIPTEDKKVDQQEVTKIPTDVPTTQKPTDIPKPDPVTDTKTTNETTKTTHPPKTTEIPTDKRIKKPKQLPPTVIKDIDKSEETFDVYNTDDMEYMDEYLDTTEPDYRPDFEWDGESSDDTDKNRETYIPHSTPPTAAPTDSREREIDEEEVFEFPTERPAEKPKQIPTTFIINIQPTEGNVDKYNTDDLEPTEEYADMDIELQDYDDDVPYPVPDDTLIERPAGIRIVDLFPDTGSVEDADGTGETFNPRTPFAERPTERSEPEPNNEPKRKFTEKLMEIPMMGPKGILSAITPFLQRSAFQMFRPDDKEPTEEYIDEDEISSERLTEEPKDILPVKETVDLYHPDDMDLPVDEYDEDTPTEIPVMYPLRDIEKPEVADDASVIYIQYAITDTPPTVQPSERSDNTKPTETLPTAGPAEAMQIPRPIGTSSTSSSLHPEESAAGNKRNKASRHADDILSLTVTLKRIHEDATPHYYGNDHVADDVLDHQEDDYDFYKDGGQEEPLSDENISSCEYGDDTEDNLSNESDDSSSSSSSSSSSEEELRTSRHRNRHVPRRTRKWPIN